MDSMALLQEKSDQSVQEYTTKFRNIVIMLCISQNSLDVLLKYLGGPNCHLCEKVILFKLKMTDEASI